MEEVKIAQKNVSNKQPSNIEAEQALLGSILVNNDIIDEISTKITSSVFYDPAHIKIYDVIENLNNKGMIANPITLKNFFEKDNMLNEVGGTEYLVKLTRFSGSTKQALDYAKLIHEMYLRRELVSISEKLSYDTLNANAQEQDAENIIENTEKSLFNLAERGSFSQSFIEFKKAIDRTIEMATLAMQSDRGIVGVPTGLTDLDEKLGGLHKSDLIILAGRPSMGKTAFAMNIARSAAIKQHVPVVIFSMEMPKEQIAMRMLASLARVDQKKISTGKVAAADWPRLTSAVQLLDENVNLFIDDTPALNPHEIRSRCRRLKRDQGLGLVVIDYLQLMQVSRATENRATEITENKLFDLFGQNVKVKSWQERNKSLVDAMKMERKASIFILGLIFLVASFNLSSSLILLSIKKLREVGMLRVLGARKKEIMTIMIITGVKTALKGALVGLAFGFAIILMQNYFPFIPLPSDVYFINYLPMELNFIDFTIICTLVIIFIVLASFFAAKKVASKNLKEALEWVK